MDLVPVVDIADPSATELDALDAACRDHGFFLLTGHGLDDVIDATWAEARRFFDADRGVKEAIRRTSDHPLGWYDRELTKRTRDHKEVFDFIAPARGDTSGANWWPDLAGFRPAMADFFNAFALLLDDTVALVHRALGLTLEVAAVHRASAGSSTVRLNRYTVGDPVPADEQTGLNVLGDNALGAHTDPGVLTLLLQDDVGGLQAESAEHGWIDVPPRPGTVVVNLGDTMQVWTNDRYRAAAHRVRPMTTSDRLSVPFFGNPHRDTVIRPIPALLDGPPRFHEYTWKEFIGGRANDNYSDIGEDDIQIDRYRRPDPVEATT